MPYLLLVWVYVIVGGLIQNILTLYFEVTEIDTLLHKQSINVFTEKVVYYCSVK